MDRIPVCPRRLFHKHYLQAFGSTSRKENILTARVRQSNRHNVTSRLVAVARRTSPQGNSTMNPMFDDSFASVKADGYGFPEMGNDGHRHGISSGTEQDGLLRARAYEGKTEYFGGSMFKSEFQRLLEVPGRLVGEVRREYRRYVESRQEIQPQIYEN